MVVSIHSTDLILRLWLIDIHICSFQLPIISTVVALREDGEAIKAEL